jgi:hypothetical protein
MFAVACTLVVGCGADQGSDTQEIIDNLTQAGYPASEIMVVDGTVFVGRDAAVTLEASREMVESGAGKEQFRTTNLVGANIDTICVQATKFTGVFDTALNDSIENYNALNLSFNMLRVGRPVPAQCDALITGKLAGPVGGSSGFPSGGLPFGSFQIGSGLSSFAVSTIAHVITHELGHTVGFRHTDFFNRSISCGGNPVNEGDGGVGAIHIPGTPTDAVVGGSIMNSCFRTLEVGEFTNTDVVALETLY